MRDGLKQLALRNLLLEDDNGPAVVENIRRLVGCKPEQEQALRAEIKDAMRAKVKNNVRLLLDVELDKLINQIVQ